MVVERVYTIDPPHPLWAVFWVAATGSLKLSSSDHLGVAMLLAGLFRGLRIGLAGRQATPVGWAVCIPMCWM